MTDLKDKKIGFALTGSFCTFSTVISELENFLKTGAEVFPIMSETAYSTSTRFGSAEFFKSQISGLCGKEIIKSVPEA